MSFAAQDSGADTVSFAPQDSGADAVSSAPQDSGADAAAMSQDGSLDLTTRVTGSTRRTAASVRRSIAGSVRQESDLNVVNPKVQRNPLDHVVSVFRRSLPCKGPSVDYDDTLDEAAPPDAEVPPPLESGDIRRQAQFDPRDWFTSIFSWKRSAIRISVLVVINLIGVLCLILVVVVGPTFSRSFSRSVAEHTQNDIFYLSFPLFLLLGMRANIAYQHYWEARGFWGDTINRIRNLARLAVLYLPPHARPRFCALLVAYSVTKKRHLRDERTMLLELADVLGPCDRRDAAAAQHSPLWCLDALSKYVADTKRQGGMDSNEAAYFHEQFAVLEFAMSSCEKVKRTPVPFAITSHLRTSLSIWVVLLPIALFGTVQWYSIPCTFVVSYIVIGVEHVATEVEAPFTHDRNSLPLGQMCDMVRANVFEVLERSRNEAAVLSLTAPRPVWHGLCEDELS